MNDKTEHPHAWFFRAIADGVPLSEFEFKYDGGERWVDIQDRYVGAIAGCQQAWQVRRKPRTIKIGNRDVSAPPETMPEVGQRCWCINFNIGIPHRWRGSDIDIEWFDLGIIRMTKEDAEEVSQALRALLRGEE